MSHVFISYARSTTKEAQQVAGALRAQGHEVWLDDEIPAHRAYADVIEERLLKAKAVVVIWSAEAVKSQCRQSNGDASPLEPPRAPTRPPDAMRDVQGQVNRPIVIVGV